jgi:hypothetical protein
VTTSTSALHERLSTIIQRGPATEGFAVRHIEGGESFSFDGDTPYPAAPALVAGRPHRRFRANPRVQTQG